MSKVYRKDRRCEVPYPLNESDKLSRRYRDGWFDARDVGEHTDKIGKVNSWGRDVYLRGFNDGLRITGGPSVQPPAPGELPPPRAADKVVDFLDQLR